jgi:hypothetical protein
MQKLHEAASEAEALEALHAANATDGLPVVIPTTERVESMLQRVEMDPDQPLGVMGPKQGAATVQKVAAAAVMAGCLPDYFPVVIASIRAVCRDEFDLTEVVQTTHSLAPVLIVNGPARNECGPINSGAGIFGPGNRAAMSIGRALSLSLINIAGANPGTTDMACFSSPSKISGCIAEAEEASPYPPLHVSRGFESEDSVVTVIAVESQRSFIAEPSGTPSRDATFILNNIAAILAGPGNLSVYVGGKGTTLVVLNPDHARTLSRAGYDRDSIRQYLLENSQMSRDVVDRIHINQMYMDPENRGPVPAIRDVSQIEIVVSGGPGAYSSVMTPWGFAPHNNPAVSEMIEVFPSCMTSIA